MILKKKIPKDFYKLFRTQNMEYYMRFLVDLYEANNDAYAFCELTDIECRAIIAETIARVNMVWWEDDTEETEEGSFTGLSPSAVLDRLVKWGWLSSDFDEKLNCYIITFPEYSQLFTELFEKLGKEDDSRERESILSIYSALYTYHADAEKNNHILKGAISASKSLGLLLSNMQDGMRAWFDELSSRKNFIGIQEVLVKELNNSDSQKYAILTTTDSFYRYKEAVKELISDILNDNEQKKNELQKKRKGMEEESLQEKRLLRALAFCEEAAQLVYQVEREFDLIEKKYNKLIELKTVFARRALARIHYILQEGANDEDNTIVLINLLNQSRKKEEILEQLRERIKCTSQFGTVSDDSFYNRRTPVVNAFLPVTIEDAGQTEKEEIADFVPKPLYTQKQLAQFMRRNMKNGKFVADQGTVSDIEDLEKLLFLWQEATEDRREEDRIRLGEEIRGENGLTFTGFTIEKEK